MNYPYIELVDWQQCSEDCRDQAVASNAYKKFHKKRLAWRVLQKKRRYAPLFLLNQGKG